MELEKVISATAGRIANKLSGIRRGIIILHTVRAGRGPAPYKEFYTNTENALTPRPVVAVKCKGHASNSTKDVAGNGPLQGSVFRRYVGDGDVSGSRLHLGAGAVDHERPGSDADTDELGVFRLRDGLCHIRNSDGLVGGANWNTCGIDSDRGLAVHLHC